MIATTAKLTELLEAASPGPWEVREVGGGSVEVWRIGGGFVASVHFLRDSERPNATLLAAAPDLARLVLTLETALEEIAQTQGDAKHQMHCHKQRRAAVEALAAVEELRL